MSRRKRFWCWMGVTTVLFLVGGYLFTGAFAAGADVSRWRAMVGAVGIIGAMLTACIPVLDALDEWDVWRKWSAPQGEPCEHAFALYGDPTIEAIDTDTETGPNGPCVDSPEVVEYYS